MIISIYIYSKYFGEMFTFCWPEMLQWKRDHGLWNDAEAIHG